MNALGFTGTRAGLTLAQIDRLLALLIELTPTACHHGMAIGADTVFARLAGSLRIRTHIVGHPCDITDQQKTSAPRNETRRVKPPLDRNHDIVDETELLIACPAGMQEEQRSGTWATIRFARKLGKKVIIIWPDGSTT